MNYKHIHPQRVTTLLKNINKYCFDSKNIIKLNLLSKTHYNYKNDKENNYKNDQINKEIEINSEIEHEVKNVDKKVNKLPDFFIPYNLDSNDDIFWCWYIFQNGYAEYNIQKSKPFSIENETKINWVTILRENKASIKQLKHKLVHLENNLVNEKKMTIQTLETICFINNIDIYIMKNKMLYKNANDNEHIIILKYCPDSKKYGILLDNSQNHKQIEIFEQELFLVKNIEKPLKSISSYKLKDLQDIASKLNINLKRKDSEKNKTKKTLYSEIQEILD